MIQNHVLGASSICFVNSLFSFKISSLLIDMLLYLTKLCGSSIPYKTKTASYSNVLINKKALGRPYKVTG